MTFSKFIKNRYAGKSVHIVASGESLRDFDYSYFDDKLTIAVNHAHKKVNADLNVFIDKGFINKECNEIHKKVYACPRYVNTNSLYFDFSRALNFEPDDRVFAPTQGKTSGAVALVIALKGNPDRIYLHGFDYGFEKYHHATAGEYNHRQTDASLRNSLASGLHYFDFLPTGKIINCSKNSKITRFKIGGLP